MWSVRYRRRSWTRRQPSLRPRSPAPSSDDRRFHRVTHQDCDRCNLDDRLETDGPFTQRFCTLRDRSWSGRLRARCGRHKLWIWHDRISRSDASLFFSRFQWQPIQPKLWFNLWLCWCPCKEISILYGLDQGCPTFLTGGPSVQISN